VEVVVADVEGLELCLGDFEALAEAEFRVGRQKLLILMLQDLGEDVSRASGLLIRLEVVLETLEANKDILGRWN
jgi:hypothetical protein